MKTGTLCTLGAFAWIVGWVGGCSGATPFLPDDAGAPGNDGAAGGSSSGSSGGGAGSSSSGAGGSCTVACTVPSDCNVCGSPPAGFVAWCCSSSTCYGWSTTACPLPVGSSSSGGGGSDAGNARTDAGAVQCGQTGQVCCPLDAGARCGAGLTCRGNGMCR